jgi:hypothetical protein
MPADVSTLAASPAPQPADHEAAGSALLARMPGDAMTFSNGVQWFGVPRTGRHRHEKSLSAGRSNHMVVFGTAHGPRLLELIAHS